MNFKIIETGEVKEIRNVDVHTNSDCFWDMEVGFPHDHPDRDEDGNIVCSQADYEDLKNYWINVVETYQNGTNPDWYETDDIGNIVNGRPMIVYTD